ncbi:MAG: hypothetical protein NC453_24945 [Muribaculum sp.]|nr:hypothetical protein [Muribaculum sp.]
MKRILSVAIIAISIVMSSGSLVAKAENPTKSRKAVLQKKRKQNSNPIYDNVLDPEGRRVPCRSTFCSIDMNGIEIEGVNTELIYQYDICDLDGECLITFSTEIEFIEYVLSATEEIEIRLYIEDYFYFGYL